MSLLGIDVGTTGCKSAVFSKEGNLLASAYEEYDFQSPEPGWFELDAVDVWNKVKRTVREAASRVPARSITALSASSLGEAMVPVAEDRRILGPSILNFDVRGAEYLDRLRSEAHGRTALSDQREYAWESLRANQADVDQRVSPRPI